MRIVETRDLPPWHKPNGLTQASPGQASNERRPGSMERKNPRAERAAHGRFGEKTESEIGVRITSMLDYRDWPHRLAATGLLMGIHRGARVESPVEIQLARQARFAVRL